MNVQTVSTVHNVLPALATLSIGVERTARLGKRVRLYQPCTALTTTGVVQDALVLLLKAGVPVRVYEGNTIYTLELDGSTVVWHKRQSRKHRANVVVEVAL